METAIARVLTARSRRLPRLDSDALAVWVLAGGIVLYLALDGGGYDIVVHSQVGIVVWWILLLGAAAKLLPAAPLARVGWAALGLFGAFVAWTAVAVTWSLSSERSFENLSLVVGYLGVLALGLAIHSDRARAIRHTIGAVAGAIVVVACLALASRLDPGLFRGAGETSACRARNGGSAGRSTTGTRSRRWWRSGSRCCLGWRHLLARWGYRPPTRRRCPC
jgi:hypothetical protein